MALTINDAFISFHKDVVNLDPDRVKTARASRDWLIEQFENLPTDVNNFPTLYAERHIKYGSFARNTKIRELDDIDLILTLNADGSYYDEKVYGSLYVITSPNTSPKLWALTNDDGTLNSIKVINKLVSSLSSISQYSKAEIHRCQEAATLKLNSYEWNFDIVPSFYTTSGHYLIPDGMGNWKASDPRVDQERTTMVNQSHSGNILQIIRTLKYWQRRPTMPTISSYLFENIILDYFASKYLITNYIDYNLRDFWQYLTTAIYSNVNDPSNFSTNLNSLDLDTQIKISIKANDDYSKSLEAIELEKKGDISGSINKWREIFGNEFPTYG